MQQMLMRACRRLHLANVHKLSFLWLSKLCLFFRFLFLSVGKRLKVLV